MRKRSIASVLCLMFVVIIHSSFIYPIDDASFDNAGDVNHKEAKKGASKEVSWQEPPDEFKDAEITTNEERGNWFFKARILKDARKLYEKIRKVIAKIEPFEDSFRTERNKMDVSLNKFYQEYGFKGGEVENRIVSLTRELEDLEKAEGVLGRDQRSLLGDLRQKKDAIESVKNDFEQLQKLDEAVNQALGILANQINKARSYDEEAWQAYEKIEIVLNDEVAEDLYRKIENSYENILAIDTYLKKNFKQFFAKSVKSIDDLVQSVTKQIVSLKEKGVALGKKMNELFDQEASVRREQEQREKDRLKMELAKAQRSWFTIITDGALFAWNKVVDAFADIFNKIRGFFVVSSNGSAKAVQSKKHT